jgi:phosphopantetheinyl transferase (holo-ACP synthase)
VDQLKMLAIGNDIIDLHHPSILGHSSRDEEWMQRHLTESEWRKLSDASEFWQIFALKEASSKAITQLGYTVPFGSFTHFEVDIGQNNVLHCSGEVLSIQMIQSNSEWIHAVVNSVVRTSCPQTVSEVYKLADNEDPSVFLQNKLLNSLRSNGYPFATFAQGNGIPLIVQDGKPLAPVSFSHSGKFAAFSWLSEKL